MMNAFNAAFLGASAYALPNGTEPLIFLDFKNGVYTVDGSSVAIGAVLAEDTDYGSFSPSDVQAGVGLVGSQPIFIGDALDLILDGSIIVCTFVLTDPGSSNARVDFEMIDSTDYNLDIAVFSGNTNGCDLNDNAGGRVKEPRLAPGTNMIAVKLIDGKIARSTNANPVRSVDPSVAWVPSPTVMLLAAGGAAIIETVGLYPADAVVDADLPTLCDLGYPTNTAAPAITGTAQVGQTLTVSHGTWAGAVTYAYQWYQVNFVGSSKISGATSSTYLVDPVDEGLNLCCSIAATNATGTSIVGVIDDDTVIAA